MTPDDFGAFMATMVAPLRPLPPSAAEAIAFQFYSLDVGATPLTGERDENFRLTCRGGAEYVLKIASAREDPAVTRMQVEALLHVERADPSLPCPRIRRTRYGESEVKFKDANDATRLARLVTWMPGVPLRTAPRSERQRAACGKLCARMGRALREFDHPAAHRAIAWDLRNVQRLQSLLSDVPALPHARFIGEFIQWYEKEVMPRFNSLRRQFVHNDFNDRNILVDHADPDSIVGIIDFGDAIHTALVADVAIAATAQVTSLESAEREVAEFTRAYHEIESLTTGEWELLGPLVAARIVAGILIPSWHRSRNPALGHYDVFDEAHIARRMALARRLMITRLATG